MSAHPSPWPHVIQTVLICAIFVSPFWFLAARLDDGDEFVKSGVGAGLAGLAALVLKFIYGKKDKGD